MSLARALTKRAKRHHEVPATPSETSFRYAAGTIERSKISLPTELLSTTNVHALNAPDIRSISTSSSNASLRSADDSDFSSMSRGFLNSPTTSPETSSVESSPIAPEPIHIKDFFNTVPKRFATASSNRSPSVEATSASDDVPVLPQRALSHSKKAHQDLARNRSLSRLTPPTAMNSPTVVRNSADIFRGAADPNHPFGKELAQVNEVAEEFGAGMAALLGDEEREMQIKGLMKFNAEDYLNEIKGLLGGAYEDRFGMLASSWM